MDRSAADGQSSQAASDPCGEAMRAAGLDSAPARKHVVPREESDCRSC